MTGLRLMGEVMSMELRRAFSYRADFWIGFFAGTLARVGMAYFLWRAIFEYSQAERIGGFTFSEMILYSILAFLVDQIVRASSFKTGIISREIYDGTLTRYLLYPISVFKYKFSISFAQAVAGGSQFIIGIAFYALIFGWPQSPALSLTSVIFGMVCLIPAMITFFLVAFLVELTAFWADNVWSLLVMLRFISAFFGGAFLPLSLFPQKIHDIFVWLPFYHMIGVPVGVFMGRVPVTSVLESITISFIWGLVFYVSLSFVWRRGVRKFSGVGI